MQRWVTECCNGRNVSAPGGRGHAHPLPITLRTRAAALCRGRGCQTRPWRPRLPRRSPRLRREDHPPRQTRTRPAAYRRFAATRPVAQKRGGRHELTRIFPGLDAAFADVVCGYTAGDPMRPGLLWTNLSLRRI